MQLGKNRINNLQADCFTRVYHETVTTAKTSMTISNLADDAHEVYILRCKFVNGYDGAANYLLRPNNVSTDNNYGRQTLSGINTTVAAARATATGFLLGTNAAITNICYVDNELYAKSGFVRTLIQRNANSIATTTVTDIYLIGQSWNNTADEITSLVILADQTNGIGVGSQIDLYKLTRKT